MTQTYKESFRQSYTDLVELSVFNCGKQSCSPGHTWGPGVRDHYLIHLIVQGKGSYTTDGNTFELGEGDVFLLKPNQLASYSASTAEPWEYYWVGFNGAFAHKLMQNTPFSEERPVFHCADPLPLQTALSDLFDARGPAAQNDARMVGHLHLFLACLMQEATQLDTRAATGSHYVSNAIKYIQFNYSHEISIDDIARSVGVSRSHLYRLFISNVGQSPIDYLTGYRIEEACNLLKNSQLSIAEIAVSVGFFDKFYFSRVFKKAKGMPPSRYLASIEASV